MPPRFSPIPSSSKGAFYPSSDSATHRDLLLFEERLKTNAASLNRRKHRYQLLLTQLLLVICFLLSEVFLQTDFLAVPCQWALRWVLPEKYRQDAEWEVHQYLAWGLLMVSVTTLVLFFLTGGYSEKIGYANRYVPHANRALRNFNMYLNVRRPPLRSKLPFNPFSFLFPRTSPSTSHASSPSVSRRRSPSPTRMSKRSSSVPIPPIPPSSNPRGELIFSSRVDKSFRESYERYRTTFERRRDEREKAAYQATWIGWLQMKLFGTPPASVGGGIASGTATPVGVQSGLGRTSSATGSTRGRGGGSSSGTPSSSRRPSPVPLRTSRLGPDGRHRRSSSRTPPSSISLSSTSETFREGDAGRLS